jgi:DNA-binding beta-propeller fold protein YncE
MMHTVSHARRRRLIFASLAGAAAATVILAIGVPAFLALHGPPARVLSGGSYGFDGTSAIVADGSHLWVANADGNSVTELNATNDSWVRTLSGRRYGFRTPSAIAVDGPHIWVVNEPGSGMNPGSGPGSLTELNASNGRWIQTLPGGRDGLNDPSEITAAGSHLWVANSPDTGSGSVTELNASNGRRVRTVTGPGDRFDAPSAIEADGSHLWVTNTPADQEGGSVTELNASNGSWIRTVSGGRYGFDGPCAIAADGTHLWVTNCSIAQELGSVTELDASDGSWIRTLSTPGFPQALLDGSWARSLLHRSYGFRNPGGIAVHRGQIWIANENSVTTLKAG